MPPHTHTCVCTLVLFPGLFLCVDMRVRCPHQLQYTHCARRSMHTLPCLAGGTGLARAGPLLPLLSWRRSQAHRMQPQPQRLPPPPPPPHLSPTSAWSGKRGLATVRPARACPPWLLGRAPPRCYCRLLLHVERCGNGQPWPRFNPCAQCSKPVWHDAAHGHVPVPLVQQHQVRSLACLHLHLCRRRCKVRGATTPPHQLTSSSIRQVQCQP